MKFISRADNYYWMSWEFRTGSGETPFSAEDAVAYYGLIIEGFNREDIIIYNVTDDMDGWEIRAVFHDIDGNAVYSD